MPPLNIPNRSRNTAQVNIVPLVDVLIVLIFFFLITMQFKDVKLLDITPPKLESAGTFTNKNTLLVGLKKDGKYIYNTLEVSLEDLEEALRKEAQYDAFKPLIIYADKEVPLKYMTSVMDTSKKAGLQKVRLQIQNISN